MLDRDEAFGGTSADALGRRIGGDQIGVIGLELFELVEQAVVFLVGNLGIVVDVVTLFVMTDRVTKLLDAFLSRLLGHAITGRKSSSCLGVFVVAF